MCALLSMGECGGSIMDGYVCVCFILEGCVCGPTIAGGVCAPLWRGMFVFYYKGV